MARWETHRTDATEGRIVDAMRKAGAAVQKIDRPLDLLVAVDGQTALGECKTAKGVLRRSQIKFLATWPGLVAVLRTPDDGIGLVTTLRRQAAEQAEGRRRGQGSGV